jgi:hypothetical protein
VDKEYVDGLHTTPWDVDHDTGIQVEESADEDMIRFDTNGAQRMVINDNGHLTINTEIDTLNVAGFGSVGTHMILQQDAVDICRRLNVLHGYFMVSVVPGSDSTRNHHQNDEKKERERCHGRNKLYRL